MSDIFIKPVHADWYLWIGLATLITTAVILSPEGSTFRNGVRRTTYDTALGRLALQIGIFPLGLSPGWKGVG